MYNHRQWLNSYLSFGFFPIRPKINTLLVFDLFRSQLNSRLQIAWLAYHDCGKPLHAYMLSKNQTLSSTWDVPMEVHCKLMQDDGRWDKNAEKQTDDSENRWQLEKKYWVQLYLLTSLVRPCPKLKTDDVTCLQLRTRSDISPVLSLEQDRTKAVREFKRTHYLWIHESVLE